MSNFIMLTDAKTKRPVIIATAAIILIESEYVETNPLVSRTIHARIQTSMDGWITVLQSIEDITALLNE